jgi:hypothetical protein
LFFSPEELFWHYDQALERALEAVTRLPADIQDEIARAMLQLAERDGEPEDIEAAHLPAVLEGLAQAQRRQFASDREIEAAFRRFDLPA